MKEIILKIYNKLYHWLLVMETFFASIKQLILTNDLKFHQKLYILNKEIYFIIKAIFFTFIKPKELKETFFHYTVYFPNYLEFVLLFIDLFGVQAYKFKNKKIETIIDAGSNLGMSILYFKLMFPQSKISAIEPDKNTVNYLIKNITINNLNNIKIFNAALSSKKGLIDFYSQQTGTISSTAASHSVKGRNEFTKIKVPSILLSKLLSRKVDVLKLDIEGTEGEVLKEAKQKLSNLTEIIMEYHPTMNMKKNSLNKIKNILYKDFNIQISDTSTIIPRAINKRLKIIHAIKKTSSD